MKSLAKPSKRFSLRGSGFSKEFYQRRRWKLGVNVLRAVKRVEMEPTSGTLHTGVDNVDAAEVKIRPLGWFPER